ncbi:DHA2 family efflux MFS transporter permease subunit [Nonomuraea endophytica]|uniref:DHA2 family efflux MFS transporter permease subunit n=1 Tax=Nonomuraea endophytica TaxID=714136 RepID=UPI0037CC31CF
MPSHWMPRLLVLIAGVFMTTVDIIFVSVATPIIQVDLSTGSEAISWVSTAYTLTLCVVAPSSLWMLRKVGLKRLYILCLLGYVIGAALCGLASSVEMLVASRIVQAVPGALIGAVSIPIILQLVPRKWVGPAIGAYALCLMASPVVGPSLGGYMAEYLDWRLIFLVNVPIGLLTAVAAFFLLPSLPEGEAGRFDVLGFLTAGIGLAALLLGLTKLPDWQWSTYELQVLFIVSAVSLTLFVVIELEVDNPLLDLRVFGYRVFATSMLLLGILFIELSTGLIYNLQFLQSVQGLGQFDAGRVLLPQIWMLIVVVPVAVVSLGRLGPRWPVVIGLSTLAFGTYQLHEINFDTPRHVVAVLLVIRSAGIGLALLPTIVAGAMALPPGKTPMVGAMVNIIRLVVGPIGAAGFTALLTRVQAQNLNDRIGLITDAGPAAGGAPSFAMKTAYYLQLQGRALAFAIGEQFLLLSALAAVGAVLALRLGSKSPR